MRIAQDEVNQKDSEQNEVDGMQLKYRLSGKFDFFGRMVMILRLLNNRALSAACIPRYQDCIQPCDRAL